MLEKSHEMLSLAHSICGHVCGLKSVTRDSIEEEEDPNLYSESLLTAAGREGVTVFTVKTLRNSHSPEDVLTHVCARGH